MSGHGQPPTPLSENRADRILQAVAHAAERLFVHGTWWSHLDDVLAALGEATDVTAVYFFEVVQSAHAPREAHLRAAWAAPNIPELEKLDVEAIQVVPSRPGAPLRRWFQLLEHDRLICGVRREFTPEEQAVLASLGIEAILVVPIHIERMWRGALGFMETRYPRRWTASEIEALRAAAHMLAAAWAQHEAQLALAEQRRHLDTLRRVLEELNASPHVQAALPSIAAHLRELTGCERVSVALLEENGRWFRVVALDAPRPELSRGTRMPVHTTHAAEDILPGRPHLTPNLAQEADKEADRLLYEAGHRSRVNVPLQVEDRVLGALNLTWREPHGYRVEHLPLLQAIARALTLAIERTRYVERLQRRQREAEILRRAAAALTAELDPRVVPERLLDYLAVLVPYDSAVVFLTHEDHLQAVATRGLPKEHRLRRFPTDNSLFVEIQRTGQPLWLADASHDPRFENWGAPHPIRAWIGAPLRARGSVIGFLTVAHKEAGVYGEHEAHLVMLIANHAAVALENARLYQEALVANRELEETLEERSELIHRVSHELRTPLTLILGLAELLAQDPNIAAASTPIQRTVETLVREAKHLRNMVNQILTWKRLERPSLHPVLIDVQDWLQEACAPWDPTLQKEGKKLVLDIREDLGQLRGDPTYLRQVLDNLLDNARKYSPANTQIRIRAWRRGPLVYIAVQDQGVGVPPDKIPYLFQPFYRLDRKQEYEQKGLGLGLTLCREIVVQYGGHIWAESAGEGKGLTVIFTLPAEDTPAG